MTQAQYSIAIDLDDDGDFADPGEDLTADVLGADWTFGFAAPHDSSAAPGSAAVTVDNSTGAYSPENSAAALLPGKALRVQATYNGSTTTLFSGVVARVVPQPGDLGGRTAVIYAAGPERWLDEAEVQLPPLLAAAADDAIAAVLAAAPLRRPALQGRWLLGVSGQGELGQNTTLPAPYPITLEAGISQFAYVDAGAGSAAALIRQFVAAERGRFFVNRDGAFVFHNRHHLLSQTGVQATFADSMDGLSYAYGAGVVNTVRVRLEPRSAGAPGSTLWTLANAQRIPAGAVRLFTAPYRDTDGNALSALAVLAPVAGVDYQINTHDDGSGEDYTGRAVLWLVSAGAGAAELRLVNQTARTLYLLPGATLRGTPLERGDPALVEQTDHASATLYGAAGLTLDLPLLDSIESADQLARYELARRATPRGTVRTLTLEAPAQTAQMLACTLFDRVRVTEGSTGHAADYFIAAEQHRVAHGGARHSVTWLLEPAAASAFWIVGTSRIAQDTVLAY